MKPLVDGHGRAITDLRVSVTDRCNFRCRYCMPADGLPWLDRKDVLSYDEIERVVALLASMGVDSVRLSGGEPLVRRELHVLVRKLTAIEALDEVTLTTNGVLLVDQVDDLVAAGLKRINISLDSLDRGRFHAITRRDDLERTMAGLEAAAAHPELNPVKVNVVAMRGVTEIEIPAFAEFARTGRFEVRFIEFMPLDADHEWEPEKVLAGEEIRAAIHAVHPLEPIERKPHSTSRNFRFADGHGEIGFINPVSQPFCADCNRLRLTADGKLRTCLFSMTETDLRAVLRSGADDPELERVIREAVWAKELKHHVGDKGFVQPRRTMSQIGG